MPDLNETSSFTYRFLTTGEFPDVYQAITTAFSDYTVTFALTEIQLRNHMSLTAVDLDRSVGCFAEGHLIGASLNGFGNWLGRPTVYDACTGVLPEFRRKGVGTDMFQFMLPYLKRNGVEQFLLEVITTNHAAVSLYEGLGFRRSRGLALLQCDKPKNEIEHFTRDVDVRELETPDWQLFREFWDVDPSWQNLPEAIDRSRASKRIIGAYQDGQSVGYIVFSARFGRISQIAVSKAHRRRGVGSALLSAMHSTIVDEYPTQVVNVDLASERTLEFFKKFGYYEKISQHEMMLEL